MSDLNDRVEDIRQARDIVFVESVKRRILEESIQAGNVDGASSINQNVPGGDPVASTKPADQRLRVTIDGSDYYIALYNV